MPDEADVGGGGGVGGAAGDGAGGGAGGRGGAAGCRKCMGGDFGGVVGCILPCIAACLALAIRDAANLCAAAFAKSSPPLPDVLAAVTRPACELLDVGRFLGSTLTSIGATKETSCGSLLTFGVGLACTMQTSTTHNTKPTNKTHQTKKQ